MAAAYAVEEEFGKLHVLHYLLWLVTRREVCMGAASRRMPPSLTPGPPLLRLVKHSTKWGFGHWINAVTHPLVNDSHW
jgi:hypothetical protein